MKTDIIKKRLIVLVMLLGMINSYAQISKAEIIATGLTCSMCSNAINKQLKAMPEVEKVMIDLNNNTFVVNIKKNSVITPQQLKANIEKTGFFVGSMILTMDVDNLQQKDNTSFKNESGTYVFVDAKEKAANGTLRLKVLNSGFVTKKEYKQSAKMLSKYLALDAQEGTYFVKTI
ncbi:heavy-metal-associated domain-containing protein [Flavobacterium sufflavum]|uniref:Heavy-metal-associated domain-containing protein n=1 Tax=Flavobacterium sufflavum TaxID=1921138 RepID=A0A3S2U565_9FLAO|nr:heavy metal-associated domain-containing protein [Flavobacterium sufflavum]RVT78597.1 heavy-metal-associated domain-containing protein [Flavobacterium sufflavum]